MPDDKRVNPDYALLDKYRETLEKAIDDTGKEYDKIITYLAAGALGLFFTINEKFFHLVESKCFWVFVVSLASLFITLIISLLNKYFDNHTHILVRDKVHDQISSGDYATTKLDQVWKKRDTVSEFMVKLRMSLLILGIAAEIFFIVINMNTKSEGEEKRPEIRIEVIPAKDSSKVKLDTSDSKVIRIKIQNQ